MTPSPTSRTVEPAEFKQVSEVAPVVRDNPHPKPNIMLILMDDVGLDIISQYQTFQISHLGFNAPVNWLPTTTGFATIKQNGVMFANAFANPTCSPTRAMLMSGRYAARQGIGIVVRDSTAGECKEYSDPDFSDEPTLAHWLKEAGYRTMMCGKYHLGLPTTDMDPTSDPAGTYGWTGPTELCGFDVFRGNFSNLNIEPVPSPSGGVLPGYYNYYWYESDNTAEQPGTVVGTSTSGHVTRNQRAQVQQFIRQGQKDGGTSTTEPWFVYWATSIAHAPYGNFAGYPNGTFSGCACPDIAGTPAVEGLAAWVYTGGYDTRWPYPSVWSCIENLAYELAILKDKIGDDVWDRTVFILMGDNGSDQTVLDSLLNGNSNPPDSLAPSGATMGADYEAMIDETGPNVGVNHFKSSVYSPGTRVPLIISGPSWLIKSPNRISYALVDAVDVHATIRRISQGDFNDAIFDNRGIDGVDMYDILRNVSGADTAHRASGMSERFTPCGTTDSATEYNYVYRELRSDGIWHLVHNDGEADELYHTMDDEAAAWAAIDVNEQNDLAGSEAVVLADMQANYATAHAAMEADQHPTV